MCCQAKYTVKQLKGVFPADVRRHGGKVAKYTLSLSACVSVRVPKWKIEVTSLENTSTV